MTALASAEPGPRVVIVDDTADLRDMLRIALGRNGMEVVGEAGDGQAGIEAVRATLPDLVLLDLSMPVMDGLAALPHIRALVPLAKIVVFSGFGATQMAERALAAGADAYLQKGTSLARMLSKVREVLTDESADSEASEPGASSTPPLAEVDAGRGSAGGLAAAAPGVDDQGLALAPFGVLEVTSAPPHRLVAVNPFARGLLPPGIRPGMELAEISPELADAVSSGPTDDRGFVDVRLGELAGRVAVRRGQETIYLYLEPSTDEIGRLRTAIATTAHELRGPVAVLCALAETITDAAEGQPLGPDVQLRLMSSLARQARMLDSITADLLTTAQIERGTLQVETRTVDPRAVVEGVIIDRSPGHEVAVEVADTRPVLADPLRLAQILGNLLSNAVKHGRPPFTFRITTGSIVDELCIEVEDAGDGVPDEFRGQLFREFSRVPGTAAAGTGLGLHVADVLARAHGGSVAYRPAEHGGSVFTLTLPTAGSESAPGA